MRGWTTYRLGDLIQLQSGGTPDKSNSDYWGGSIPWISAKSMYDDFISTSDLFITEEGLQAGSKLAKKDSILLLTRGSGLFNRIPVCYVVSDVAYNQDVKNIVLKQEDVTSIKFLYYWLYGNKELLSSMLETTGIGAGKIDTKRFLNLSISLPSQKEQARYIHLMDLLFDKIELNRRINANLEAQAQALFRSWFVDFEPFRDGPFVDSELGKIPQGWKTISLSELMNYAGGSQPPASEFINSYKDGYVRFIQIRDYASESHITYIPISSKNKTCDIRDIMIARYGASLGRICYGLTGAYNVALAKILPVKPYYREFLRSYLSSDYFYQSINMKGNRAVQAGFNQSDINSFRLSFPKDESIVQTYDKVCSQFLNKRLQVLDEIKNLSTLRDTLLPKLMAGEIKI